MKIPELAQEPDILKVFARDIAKAGLVGEQQNAQLLFLAITAHITGHPVNVCVYGPSASGKTHLVNLVLKFFPPHVYYVCVPMSRMVLKYEDVGDKILIIRDTYAKRRAEALRPNNSFVYETRRFSDTRDFDGVVLTMDTSPEQLKRIGMSSTS
jgi:hypothetical protein